MTGDPGHESGRGLTIEELARQAETTPEYLARQAETTPEYVGRLVEAGAIHANPGGSHEVENLPRVHKAPDLLVGDIRAFYAGVRTDGR